MQRGRYRNNRGGFRGGSGGGGTSTRLKGLFENGIWYCNCTPRLPAEHFKVKKDGPNHGRWFYTCQMPSEGGKRCDFFLWDEDAKPREASAVISNSRSEPRDPQIQEGWNAGRDNRGKVHFADPPKSPSPTPSPTVRYPTLPTPNSGVKRNAREAMFEDDVETDDEFSLSNKDEEELLKAAAADPTAFETPHKVQKTGVYATPATSGTGRRKIPWLQEPTTPVSSKKTFNDYFTSPSKQPAKVDAASVVNDLETPYGPPTLRNPESPSPASRYKDALLNPADSQSSLTSEVLAELASVRLPPEILSSLRSILSKHDLKTQGVIRGRDISRLALKAKEAKVTELEARIASLQAEKEVDRSLIEQLKWKKDNSQEDLETDDEL